MNDLLNIDVLLRMKRFEIESATNYRKGWNAYLENGLSAMPNENPFFNLGFAKSQEHYSSKMMTM